MQKWKHRTRHSSSTSSVSSSPPKEWILHLGIYLRLPDPDRKGEGFGDYDIYLRGQTISFWVFCSLSVWEVLICYLYTCCDCIVFPLGPRVLYYAYFFLHFVWHVYFLILVSIDVWI